ncbi:hypothetical protein Tco_1499577 [Tanacetum coccineum]
MDQDSAHMVAASKVPMLKPGEYELWRMRMEQYIQMIDYSLWEVIENGNAPPITKVVEGVETIIAPTTAEEKAQRRMLKKSFEGMHATKRLRGNLLKQRELEIMVKVFTRKIVNQSSKKFVTRMETTHYHCVEGTLAEIDTLSLDDLYNNLKIYK